MPELPAIDAPAPDFALPRHGGGTWSLREKVAQRRRPIVLVFHRHIH